MTIWHSQAVNEEDHGTLRYSIILEKVETVEGVFYHLFVEESCKKHHSHARHIPVKYD